MKKNIPIIRDADFDVLQSPMIQNFLKRIPHSSWIKFAEVMLSGFGDEQIVRLKTIGQQYKIWAKKRLIDDVKKAKKKK